jgi:hypothetical protein
MACVQASRGLVTKDSEGDGNESHAWHQRGHLGQKTQPLQMGRGPAHFAVVVIWQAQAWGPPSPVGGVRLGMGSLGCGCHRTFGLAFSPVPLQTPWPVLQAGLRLVSVPGTCRFWEATIGTSV